MSTGCSIAFGFPTFLKPLQIRLGCQRCSKNNLWGLLKPNFYRPNSLLSQN